MWSAKMSATGESSSFFMSASSESARYGSRPYLRRECTPAGIMCSGRTVIPNPAFTAIIAPGEPPDKELPTLSGERQLPAAR